MQTATTTSTFATIRTNMRDPIRRRNVALLFTGKALGLALVFGLIYTLMPGVAHAQETSALDEAQINAINTAWVLIAAFLVFGMQVGFVMLEAGFARERESVNILVEGIADTAICGILFYAIGFAFMFEDGNKFIGTHGFFLQDLPATYGSTGIPLLAFWLFQFAFADTASTITSGAMVGRCGFVGDLLYSVAVTGFIYPIVGHWCWGPDGWLAVRGFRDFAGSTVVHTIGGAIALAGALALGPRVGRVFKRDGGGPFPPHNLLFGAVGGLILWFGWYGFNPGSTLSALDAEGIGRVSANTTLAACTGGLTCLFYAYAVSRKWDLGLLTNGFLGGLVAITAPCYWVSPEGALAIGVGGGIAVIVGLEALEYLRIDDPIGAVPVHMVGGIWGTLALGLFATGDYGLPGPTGADTSTTVEGLLYGGGGHQLWVQTYGNLSVLGATLGISLVVMFALRIIGVLRVSDAGEREGLDLAEHGSSAYPEFVVNRGFGGFGVPDASALAAAAPSFASTPAGAGSD